MAKSSKPKRSLCQALTQQYGGDKVPCVAYARVERDGKLYCGRHDPVRVELRLQTRLLDKRVSYANYVDREVASIGTRHHHHDAPDLVYRVRELHRQGTLDDPTLCKCCEVLDREDQEKREWLNREMAKADAQVEETTEKIRKLNAVLDADKPLCPAVSDVRER